MLGGKKHNEINPGDYSHDAAQISKLGKIGCLSFGTVGVIGEIGDFVSDLLGSEGIADDLRAAGYWGIAATAGLAAFHRLQIHFEETAEHIQAERVTE